MQSRAVLVIRAWVFVCTHVLQRNDEASLPLRHHSRHQFLSLRIQCPCVHVLERQFCRHLSWPQQRQRKIGHVSCTTEFFSMDTSFCTHEDTAQELASYTYSRKTARNIPVSDSDLKSSKNRHVSTHNISLVSSSVETTQPS